jgi:hypothetical protein
METDIPLRYKLAVYDLKDSLTMTDFTNAAQYNLLYSFNIDRNSRPILVGRATEANSPDIVLNNSRISRRQGKFFMLPEDSSDGLLGVIYQNLGQSQPVPSFSGENVEARKNMLLNGKEVRMYPGERLVFQDEFELKIEDVK